MKFIFLILIFLSPFVIVAQSDEDSVRSGNSRKLELSLNITSTLSNALGNTNNAGLLLDPYLIGIKCQLKKRIYLRSGIGIKSHKSSENFGQRDVIEKDYKLRLGIEKRIPVMSKMLIYYGLDVLGGYFLSDVTTSDLVGPQLTEIKSNQIFYGVGPLVGFMYKLNKHIAFSTEAALYYQLIWTHRLMYLGFPDPTPVESTKNGYSLTPLIPSSLYVTIIF